ncbi:copper-binding protein [Phenylobacterium sp.]|uniref:copper-binding protein n=1 Tax=Phenylobacterium sp. TaxID=1871053 RepID=UPI00286A34D4|nr:copper-binding protein [Phenylobacterium sp.]
MKIMLIAAAALAFSGPALAQAAHDTPAMTHMDPAAPAPGAQGSGIIRKLDAKGGAVTLQHGPIAALKWPAMTMTFKIEPGLLTGLRVGQKVDFTVKPGATPEVVAIKSAG